MLIMPKDKVLSSYLKVAQNKLLDKDLLIVKLQNIVTAGDLTAEEIQPIMDVIEPPKQTRLSKVKKMLSN